MGSEQLVLSEFEGSEKELIIDISARVKSQQVLRFVKGGGPAHRNIYLSIVQDHIDGPRKSDHWLRDKNRWLEEVKKTTTNQRNES